MVGLGNKNRKWWNCSASQTASMEGETVNALSLIFHQNWGNETIFKLQ